MRISNLRFQILPAFLLLFFLTPLIRAAEIQVHLVRVPDSGVQPQAAVDDKGVVHLIYLAGDPSHTNIFAVQSSDGGQAFSKPVQVNSQAGSAVSMGTVRGAHLAIGKAGRLHVAWMGSMSAEPKMGRLAPMLYARSTDDGKGFEPQRNVIQANPGLDGGGSIAADARGNVYISWHAPAAGTQGEDFRRVWLAQSHDDGTTFAPESALTADTGACGCCGMRLFAHDGELYALYRTADQKIERDMTLLRIDPTTNKAASDVIGKTRNGACVMSTAALTANPKAGVIGAWETTGQIYWSPLPAHGALAQPIAVPGRVAGRKHPALAANAAGQTLLAWTEGTGWNKGGSVAWQIYDAVGKPLENAKGRADGLPAWGSPAVVARDDGTFVVVY